MSYITNGIKIIILSLLTSTKKLKEDTSNMNKIANI